MKNQKRKNTKLAKRIAGAMLAERGKGVGKVDGGNG